MPEYASLVQNGENKQGDVQLEEHSTEILEPDILYQKSFLPVETGIQEATSKWKLGFEAHELSTSSTAGSEKSGKRRRMSETSDEESVQKPYECRFCPMKFAKSQALGGHMNRHRQEREREQLLHARQLVMQQGFSTLMVPSHNFNPIQFQRPFSTSQRLNSIENASVAPVLRDLQSNLHSSLSSPNLPWTSRLPIQSNRTVEAFGGLDVLSTELASSSRPCSASSIDRPGAHMRDYFAPDDALGASYEHTFPETGTCFDLNHSFGINGAEAQTETGTCFDLNHSFGRNGAEAQMKVSACPSNESMSRMPYTSQITSLNGAAEESQVAQQLLPSPCGFHFMNENASYQFSSGEPLRITNSASDLIVCPITSTLEGSWMPANQGNAAGAGSPAENFNLSLSSERILAEEELASQPRSATAPFCDKFDKYGGYLDELDALRGET